MRRTFKSVLSHLKLYVGHYFTIVALIGSLWTIFVFYDKWKDDKIQMRNEISTLKQQQKDHKKSDSTMFSFLIDEQDRLQTRLVTNESKTDVQGKAIKSMKTFVVRYISQDEALTREDFIRFILEIYGDSSIIQMYPYLLPKNKTKK